MLNAFDYVVYTSYLIFPVYSAHFQFTLPYLTLPNIALPYLTLP